MFSSTKEKTIKDQAQNKSDKKGSLVALAGKIIAWQIMAVMLVEASLFVAGLGEEEIYKLDPELGFRHMCNKKITWRSEGFATSYFDKEGLRESGITVAKPAGTYRVALLGDSLTESLQVPVEESFGYKIEKKLSDELGRPVQVINFGTSGYSTVQEYLQLKKQVLKFNPDLVLLCYNSRDCFENWSPPDEVLTNVRPAALHLPGQKLTIDCSPVTGWMKTPRARFLKNVEFLRENSRLWGLYAAAELDWSMHNETYKKLSLFMTRPGKAIRLTFDETKAWFNTQIKQLRGAAASKKLSTASAVNESAGSSTASLTHGNTAILAPSSQPSGSVGKESVSKSAPGKPAPGKPAILGASSKDEGSVRKESAAKSGPESKVSAASSSEAPKSGRLNYQDLIVRTLGSLFYEMKTVSEANGAKFAVVALPVRSALSAKQGMQTAFLDFDYNDEIKMLQGICAEKQIPLLNVHEDAKTLPAKDKDALFFLVHYTAAGHEFVAKALAPKVDPYVKETPAK